MRTFILLCLLIATSAIFAQNDKFTVGIQPFDCVIKADSRGIIEGIGSKTELQQLLYSVISSAFQKTQLFTIVERVRNSAISQEQQLQKQADFVGGTTQIDETAFIGAQYVVTGNLTTIVREQGAFGGDYKVRAGYDIKILDITTSEVVAAEYFENEAISKTAEGAFTTAINQTQTKVMRFLFKNFKPELRIVDIEEKTEILAKKIVLNGSLSTLKKGDVLSIIEEIVYEVEGKKLIRKKEIGQAKILQIEGGNFATAEITKGGQDVLSKFNTPVKLKALPVENESLNLEEPTKNKSSKKKKDNLNDFY